MRDFSNLDWPDSPFGADHRPIGKQPGLATGFAFGETRASGPAAMAVCYMRAARTGHVLSVSPYMRFGYRCVIAENPADELGDLHKIVDRSLLQARRHALVLGARGLRGHLVSLLAVSAKPLPGVTGVLEAWDHRETKQRGLALMVEIETDTAGIDSTMIGRSSVTVRQHDSAHALLVEALTSALLAGMARGLVRLNDEKVDLGAAVDEVAWDHLSRGSS